MEAILAAVNIYTKAQLGGNYSRGKGGVHIPPNTRGVEFVLIELQLICHLGNLY